MVDRSVGVQCEIVELMTTGVQTTVHVDVLFEAQGQRPGVELGQEAAPSGANDSSPGWFDSVREDKGMQVDLAAMSTRGVSRSSQDEQVDERSAWIEDGAHPRLVEARSAEPGTFDCESFDTISVKEELRERFGKFGEMGDEYMDGMKISGSEIRVSMSTQANVGDGMQPSSVLRSLQ